MPSEESLRVLRNRRAALAVTIANKTEIIEAATVDAKSANAFVFQVDKAQKEHDALDDVLNHLEHETDRPKIPVHPSAFIIAVALWFAVTVAILLFVR